MPASWSVANKAMDAPTGPDGVRPCDFTSAGKSITPQSKRRDNHRPARRMARLYRRQEEGTSLRPTTSLVLPNERILTMSGAVFLELPCAGFL
jgi:hypothetical protein